jgi:8-oxo-dGTP diphosphatase
MARVQVQLEMSGSAVALTARVKRFTAFVVAVVHTNRPHCLDNDGRHRLQQCRGVGARSWPTKQLADLAIEAARNTEPHELTVVFNDRRAGFVWVRAELDLSVGDRQVGQRYPQYNQHVMNLERIRITLDVDARWLYVPYRSDNHHVVVVAVHLGVIATGVQQRELFERNRHGHLVSEKRVPHQPGIRYDMRFTPVVGTLAYLLDPTTDQVLIIRRNARPNDDHFGKVNGLGGKVEVDEDIVSSARREVLEESGLSATDMQLRGTVTFSDFGPKREQWLVFIFLVTDWTGQCMTANNEGELEWVDRSALLEACQGGPAAIQLPMWPGDKHFLPFVFDDNQSSFHGTMPYDGDFPVSWSYERV